MTPMLQAARQAAGGLWAAVALKSPHAAKSRLRERLDTVSRRRLFLAMAEHTLRTLAQTPGIDGVAVVTASEEIAALAARHGATVIREGQESGTAEAFRTAVEALSDRAARLLLISGDLPLLSTAALTALIAAGGGARPVVIARDRHGRGTNALLCTPAANLPLHFGEDSLARHLAAARARRLEVRVVNDEALALDIDEAEDFELLLHHARSATLAAGLRECLGTLEEAPVQ